jgi:hypothetical protein
LRLRFHSLEDVSIRRLGRKILVEFLTGDKEPKSMVSRQDGAVYEVLLLINVQRGEGGLALISGRNGN